MADITVEIVSVERVLWSGHASIVTAQTTEGELGVQPGHVPFLGQLAENGIVTVTPVDGSKLVAAVQGGFISVSADKITVLAEYAIWSNEVDTTSAEANLQSSDALSKARAEAELKAVRRSAGV
ncbi:F0F1 ATP synthase subunit epsilon [Corynebacterium sp. sy039]|uniref:F0F1 ATP synthase subunit epsilon n=1 Tax=Corynebacterium sp. sy039 TaxID=2599641 RepID=UPI0011B56504|nr:F0F1 ATP synthase subunit epsilon [Corynebacterium sp. sy039]QDZ42385.1 F0F1 ATP synthase subunit epsilon [Corynebacterium sp. sy039]